MVTKTMVTTTNRVEKRKTKEKHRFNRLGRRPSGEPMKILYASERARLCDELCAPFCTATMMILFLSFLHGRPSPAALRPRFLIVVLLLMLRA